MWEMRYDHTNIHKHDLNRPARSHPVSSSVCAALRACRRRRRFRRAARLPLPLPLPLLLPRRLRPWPVEYSPSSASASTTLPSSAGAVGSRETGGSVSGGAGGAGGATAPPQSTRHSWPVNGVASTKPHWSVRPSSRLLGGGGCRSRNESARSVVTGTARTDPQVLAKITGASKTQVRRAPCAQCSSVTRKPVGFGCWVTTPSRHSEAPPNATLIPPAPQPRPNVALLVAAPQRSYSLELQPLVDSAIGLANHNADAPTHHYKVVNV